MKSLEDSHSTVELYSVIVSPVTDYRAGCEDRTHINSLQDYCNAHYTNPALVFIFSQVNSSLFNIIIFILFCLLTHFILSLSQKPRAGLILLIKKSFFGSK